MIATRTTMPAVVKHGHEPGMVALREVPVPAKDAGALPGGTVLVRVERAGVCGWDIEMWQHRMANPVTVPVIQGHEFCGTIAAVGEGVTAWKEGDRVACETSAVVCGRCRCCRRGDYHLCPDRKGFGYGVDGAFAPYVVVREAILHRLPETLGFEAAALAEPFCVCHQALVDRGRVSAGDAVLVIGPGPIGLASLQMAKLSGAATTLLLGTPRSGSRLELATARGWADAAAALTGDDAAAWVKDQTGGEGIDVVVDCAGKSEALKLALRAVRRGGQVIKIGWGPKPFEHSLDDLLRKGATLSGSFSHNSRNWEAVLALLAAGRLDAKGMISDVVPLERWHEAFQRVENREAVKMVLRPEAS